MTLLGRYLQVAALKACVLVALGLTCLFSLFEFVDQLGAVGHGRYHLRDAASYVALTAPYRLLEVTPVSMLLGCLLAFGALGRHGELTAMRSLGISERRVMASAMGLALPVIGVLFLLAEFVIPPAQRLAQEGRSSALSALTTTRGEDSFWAQGEGRFLNVQRFENGNVPAQIDIFTFGTGGDLLSFLQARHADIRPDGLWLLSGVTRQTIEHGQFITERFAHLSWRSFMSAEQTRLLILPPSSMPPIALFRYVRYLRRNEWEATRYEQEIWAKLSIPFSVVAMIMIAAPFVFGPPRSQTAGFQLLAGAAIGIAFATVEQITSRLDQLLDLDPGVLALAPSLLLMVTAVYLFLLRYR